LTFEEHCIESEKLFGKTFSEIHQWLDEFAGKPPHGMRHRKFRHHEVGILEIQQLFGVEAAKAARQHIISDLKEEGWTENDPFPTSELHYIQIGFF
jgi:hypothetical protein